MKKRLLLTSICLLSTLVALDQVAAQSEGVIEGQVINATGDAPSESVAGLEVGLYVVTTEDVEFIESTSTDEGGRFHFRGQDTDDEIGYRFEVEYEGIIYNEESAFPQGEAVMPVVITIYETTDSEKAMVVNRHHVIVDFVADTLDIQEMYILQNTTDRIYVGEEEGTLRFSLPTDATNLQLDDPGLEYNTIGTDDGFASLVPVVPGQGQVLFSYTVPYDGSDRALVHKIPYPTTYFDLMIADVGVLAESQQLPYQGLSAGAETNYLHFQAQDLLPDVEIETHLSGAPRALAETRPPASSLGLSLQKVSPWIALCLALLGALLPFAQTHLRRRPQRVGDRRLSRVLTARGADSTLRVRREELLQLMADLDDAFTEGQIAEEAYKDLRASMKQRVIDTGEDR